MYTLYYIDYHKYDDADVWQRFSEVMKRCVDSNIFQRGILVAILINTLSMGVEHHNQVTHSLYIILILTF